MKRCKDCEHMEYMDMLYKIDCYYYCNNSNLCPKVKPEQECFDPVYVIRECTKKMTLNHKKKLYESKTIKEDKS